MSSSPKYKVYDASGTYQAACKEIEAAAALVALYGDGSTIRFDHRTALWREGKEIQPAGESYDYVAELATEREAAMQRKAFNRAYH